MCSKYNNYQYIKLLQIKQFNPFCTTLFIQLDELDKLDKTRGTWSGCKLKLSRSPVDYMLIRISWVKILFPVFVIKTVHKTLISTTTKTKRKFYFDSLFYIQLFTNYLPFSPSTAYNFSADVSIVSLLTILTQYSIQHICWCKCSKLIYHSHTVLHITYLLM